jgi:hypothetical protein
MLRIREIVFVARSEAFVAACEKAGAAYNQAFAACDKAGAACDEAFAVCREVGTTLEGAKRHDL